MEFLIFYLQEYNSLSVLGLFLAWVSTIQIWSALLIVPFLLQGVSWICSLLIVLTLTNSKSLFKLFLSLLGWPTFVWIFHNMV